MTPRQIRSRLEQRRDIGRQRLGLVPIAAGEPGDDGDMSSVADARTLSFLSREMALADVRACDRALERLNEGRFGICPDCEQTIAPARLKANIAVMRCIDCQRAEEARERIREDLC
jgi:DnaK suppressor protein